MYFWLIILSLVPLTFWGVALWRGVEATRRVPQLSKLPVGELADLPALTVVVPARNEEATVEVSLRSLLAQDYPGLQIVAVDDRSTDGTGGLMDKVAAESSKAATTEPSDNDSAEASHASPHLEVLHVTELPTGWLGKCNALALGAAKAQGEYILFSDGDVIFEPTALRRAMGHVRTHDADFLVVLPDMVTEHFGEQVMIFAFAQSFAAAFPPVSVMNRRSNRYMGVGAFNLIRAKLYQRIQGHQRLRLQVIDDVGLGKLVKYAGGNILIAFGIGMLRVEWHRTIGGIIRGLEKNGFAALGYSVFRTCVAALALLYLYWWPWVGLFMGPWPARVLCAMAVLTQPIMGLGARHFTRMNPLVGLFLPVGMTLQVWAMLRSMIVTLRQGGIRWRDSFYSLNELRPYKL